MTIYKIYLKMSDSAREDISLWGDYDDAISYFNGVKRNPNCTNIIMTKLETYNGCSCFVETDTIGEFERKWVS
jgi:hypothetical protein